MTDRDRFQWHIDDLELEQKAKKGKGKDDIGKVPQVQSDNGEIIKKSS